MNRNKALTFENMVSYFEVSYSLKKENNTNDLSVINNMLHRLSRINVNCTMNDDKDFDIILLHLFYKHELINNKEIRLRLEEVISTIINKSTRSNYMVNYNKVIETIISKFIFNFSQFRSTPICKDHKDYIPKDTNHYVWLYNTIISNIDSERMALDDVTFLFINELITKYAISHENDEGYASNSDQLARVVKLIFDNASTICDESKVIARFHKHIDNMTTNDISRSGTNVCVRGLSNLYVHILGFMMLRLGLVDKKFVERNILFFFTTTPEVYITLDGLYNADMLSESYTLDMDVYKSYMICEHIQPQDHFSLYKLVGLKKIPINRDFNLLGEYNKSSLTVYLDIITIVGCRSYDYSDLRKNIKYITYAHRRFQRHVNLQISYIGTLLTNIVKITEFDRSNLDTLKNHIREVKKINNLASIQHDNLAYIGSSDYLSNQVDKLNQILEESADQTFTQTITKGFL